MRYGFIRFSDIQPFLLSSLNRTLMGIALSGLALSATAGISVSPSGAATYSIGVTVPPGIAGVEPKITINYSSQSGTGFLGYGWSLGGFSSISRCPKTSLQDGFDRPVLDSNGLSSATIADGTTNTTDAFCLDGQRLIKFDALGTNNPKPGLANGEYRLEQEGYSRIRYDSSVNRWTVETKSGNMMIYGGGTTASPPGANGSTRSWLITTISDNKNNAVTFTYEQGTSAADRRITNITYGPNGSNVLFFFYENRTDPQTGWLNGVQNINDKRLRMIQVVGKNTSGNSVEIRRYLLSYDQSSLTARNRLIKVQECVPQTGYGVTELSDTATNSKANQKCLPSQQFTYYSNGSLSLSATFNGPSFTDPGYNDATKYTTFQWADIDGDGFADICVHNTSGLSCYLTKHDASGNLSWNAETSPNVTLGNFSSGVDWRSTQWSDINGDGRLDACARFTDGFRCYLNTTASAGSPSFNPTPIKDTYWADGPGWNGPYYTTQSIDINSDGFPDICGRGQDGIRCHLNASGTSFSSIDVYGLNGVSNNALKAAYSLSGGGLLNVQTYSTVHYVDINADGYVDACAFVPGASGQLSSAAYYTQYCWLNNRNGGFNSNSTATGVVVGPTTSYPVDYSAVDAYGYAALNIGPDSFIDLNSDGKPDYCLRTTNGMACWINQQDSSGNPKMVATTISGLTGLLVSSADWGLDQYSSSIQFVDINGDSRPDLCARGSAGMGCIVNVPIATAPYFNFQQAPTNGFAPLLPDNPYNTPSLYKSIRFFSLANGRTGLFARQSSAASQIFTMGNLGGSEANDLLTNVAAGSTPSVNIIYGNGAITSGLYQKSNFGGATGVAGAFTQAPALPAADLSAPMSLVSQIKFTDPYTSTTNSTFYNYAGLMAQIKRGLLGFRFVRSETLPSGNWVETAYALDWPYIGLPEVVSTGNINVVPWPTSAQAVTGTWLSQTKNSYTAIDLVNSSNNVADTAPASSCTQLAPKHIGQQLSNANANSNFFVYPYRTVANTRSVDSANLLSTVITDTVMEATQGNVTCVSVKTKDGLDATKIWEKVTNNTYDTNTAWISGSLWFPGRLLSSTVTTKAPTSAFITTPVLGSSQGGYSQLPFKPNDTIGSEAPVYPDIAAWFVGAFRPLN